MFEVVEGPHTRPLYSDTFNFFTDGFSASPRDISFSDVIAIARIKDEYAHMDRSAMDPSIYLSNERVFVKVDSDLRFYYEEYRQAIETRGGRATRRLQTYRRYVHPLNVK